MVTLTEIVRKSSVALTRRGTTSISPSMFYDVVIVGMNTEPMVLIFGRESVRNVEGGEKGLSTDKTLITTGI